MLAFHPHLFVRIVELDGPRAPMPKPLSSGFNPHRAYRVLGVYNPSESSDAYFILANDRDEMWFICQRHLRFAGLHDTAAHHLDWPSEHASAAD
ncbi:hypothetical protein GO986_00530 [Deinococcus sp. HMF7620]|uniref:Uncharacterized protein n=1 Tax=Deinococcus arboris TaxID=2682977 RepID=A0A7C9LKZ4_9DEIO|nr:MULTISPECIES: hypothetical protein [Deinococcus]MBZ9750628.1 hypothetical protein [Deinococcus betulae]MVN85256.1 hypothetical protein [Deinococcus arboris]